MASPAAPGGERQIARGGEGPAGHRSGHLRLLRGREPLEVRLVGSDLLLDLGLLRLSCSRPACAVAAAWSAVAWACCAAVLRGGDARR